MKEFFSQMGKYFARYKGYIAGTFAMNILAAVFNVFSFSILLPILQILFTHLPMWASLQFPAGSKQSPSDCFYGW